MGERRPRVDRHRRAPPAALLLADLGAAGQEGGGCRCSERASNWLALSRAAVRCAPGRVRALSARMVTSRCSGSSGPSTPSRAGRPFAQRGEGLELVRDVAQHAAAVGSEFGEAQAQPVEPPRPACAGRQAVDVDRAGEAVLAGSPIACSMRPSGRSSHPPASAARAGRRGAGRRGSAGRRHGVRARAVHEGEIALAEMVVQRRGEPVGERAEVAEVVRRGEVAARPGRSGGAWAVRARRRSARVWRGSPAMWRCGPRRRARPRLRWRVRGRPIPAASAAVPRRGWPRSAGRVPARPALVLARAAFEVHAGVRGADAAALRASARCLSSPGSRARPFPCRASRPMTAAARLAVISRKLASRMPRKER